MPAGADSVAALRGPAGGVYEVRLPGIPAQAAASYRLDSLNEEGGVQQHGPFTVEAASNASLSQALRQLVSRISPGRPAPAATLAAPAQVSSALATPAKVPATQATPVTVRPATPNRAPYALAKVGGAGVYFVSAAELAAATGRSAAEFMELLQDGGLGLAQEGAAVAHLPADDGSGLYFYAPPPRSLYTTERTFWFTGLRSLPMAEVEGGAPAGAGNTWHRQEQRHEQNSQMVITLSNDPEEDTWMWNSVLSGSPALGRRTYSFGVTGLQAAAGNGLAGLKLRLFGSDAGTRRVRAEIHNDAGTHDVGAVTWTGRQPVFLEASFAADKLVPGANWLIIQAEVPDGAAANSIVYTDWFEVAYPALARAGGGLAAVNADESGVHSAAGFASDQIGVLDVTTPLRPQVVLNATVSPDGAGGHRVAFQAVGGRRYVAFDATQVPAPRTLEPAGNPGLSLQRTRASYVIIAHPSLLEAVAPLAAYREAGGLSVKVVSLTDIANEFGHGVATPQAIQRFLRTAWERWSTRPAYALLVGDGSWDYRNLLGKDDNLVPPRLVGTQFGLYSSDSIYGDVDGDGRRDIAVGRVPATTPQQVADFIAKLRAYEAGVPAVGGRALLVADAVDGGGDFLGDSELVRGLLEPVFETGVAYRDTLGSAAAVHAAVLEAFRGDLDFFAYTGHGGHTQFGSTTYLGVPDVAALGNAGRNPLRSTLTIGL
ncbi:MAG TPA: C25 family cysteine peptidase, partial [Verrucomicrobiota bacterium]|nr:C25 family cysteine peptidase [Verrucomicrobiota bacterium]